MDLTTALNERQERFCREYAHRPVGRWAAALAGYDQQNAASQACRLLRREDIQNRIAQCRALIVQRQCRDADAILASLHAIVEIALINHEYNPAINALALQARIAGLLPGQGGRNAAMTAMLEAAAGQAADAAAPEAKSPPAPIEADQSQPDLASAGETGLPGETAAAEPQDLPCEGETDGEPASKPIDADQSQSIAETAGAQSAGAEEAGGETAESTPLPPAPHPDGVAAATIAAQMPIDANQGQPISPYAIPKNAAITRWPSGRMRRTRSGRRK